MIAGTGGWAVAFTPSWGAVNVSGWSRAERNADLERFNALVALMPHGRIRALVADRLTKAQTGPVHARLGSPERFARFVGDYLGHQGAASVERDAEPTARAVDEESRAVAQECVRQWVDAILSAWRCWGRAAGFVLLAGERLVPLPPEPGGVDVQDLERWASLRRQAQASLLVNLPIDEADHHGIMTAFSGELRHVLEARQSIDLPDRVRIVPAGSSRAHVIARS
jgi:hypothetical protein